jgi:hypothetical protein
MILDRVLNIFLHMGFKNKYKGLPRDFRFVNMSEAGIFSTTVDNTMELVNCFEKKFKSFFIHIQAVSLKGTSYITMSKNKN